MHHFGDMQVRDGRDRISILKPEGDNFIGSHQPHRFGLPAFRHANSHLHILQVEILLPRSTHGGVFESHIRQHPKSQVSLRRAPEHSVNTGRSLEGVGHWRVAAEITHHGRQQLSGGFHAVVEIIRLQAPADVNRPSLPDVVQNDGWASHLVSAQIPAILPLLKVVEAGYRRQPLVKHRTVACCQDLLGEVVREALGQEGMTTQGLESVEENPSVAAWIESLTQSLKELGHCVRVAKVEAGLVFQDIRLTR